uniref:peptidylprolyl isomerase n=1 Tax=Timema shepardi TaxID=629360 RepID=A0A7R9B6I7_TIMSH|nr:unnamed protein product [Timema shepardi]
MSAVTRSNKIRNEVIQKGVRVQEVHQMVEEISVYYTGRLKQNNKQFDSVTKGPGFKFKLGRNEVIRGWDIALAGMKVGGKRKVVIPPPLAYGTKGSPPVIPPNSALVFEVELLSLN